jgi:2-polyprenyl-6-methoxyphenol hydroxylase-like FAD-dependent oxidoreductase
MRAGCAVAIIGAGPAGLFLARMIRLAIPGAMVEVFERNGPDEASGFGVSLSGRTMREIARHDPRTHERVAEASVTLPGVELRLPGTALRYDGFALSAISRHTLLTILREQAEEVGARLYFRHEALPAELDADVVACADGAASAHRTAGREAFGTSTHTGAARFIWLGTSAALGDVAAFSFVSTEHGPLAAHSYPYGGGMSTVVVETDDATWRRAGFAGSTEGEDAGEIGAGEIDAGEIGAGEIDGGEIDGEALSRLSGIFASQLSGHRLVSNASRWARFTTVRNQHWSHRNVVLVGDAAHTAHFTVGSGTKMALEDAMALASALRVHDDRADAFRAYEQQRRAPVSRTQHLAELSMHWWETYGRRLHLPPAQFGLHFITRTAALSYVGLRRRCPDRIDEAEAAFRTESGLEPGGPLRNAVAAPLRLAGRWLPNRLVTVATRPPASNLIQPLGSGLVLVSPGDTAAAAAAPPTAIIGTLRDQDSAPAQPAPAQPAPAESGTSPGFVLMRCPVEPGWADAGDELCRRAALLRAQGADGVLLVDDRAGGTRSGWDRTLSYASRIRTQAGLAVAVCVPVDWALDLTLDTEADAWPTRIHVALISGQIDLVACCLL